MLMYFLSQGLLWAVVAQMTPRKAEIVFEVVGHV